VIDHSRSYRGVSIRALLHRARLRTIRSLLSEIPLPPTGALADFGCSNGFILASLRGELFPHPDWVMAGFDHAPWYVEAARERRIAGASFEHFDLDVKGAPPPAAFDLVLCLETLEHTGNYRVGLDNLARATGAGGHLLITVPNERGLPGILKFFGRKILMREDYHAFFKGASDRPYVAALLRGADLEAFRNPPRHGWGEHLGFDWVRFEEALERQLLAGGSFALVARRRPAWGFGRAYLLRRIT
jgi:trans-aconitate methyltransferase